MAPLSVGGSLNVWKITPLSNQQSSTLLDEVADVATIDEELHGSVSISEAILEERREGPFPF